MRHRMIVVLAALAGLYASDQQAAGIGVRVPGPLRIHKVPVTDCRVVRGFLGTPVDGSVRSWDYRGTVCEYPQTASDGVAYAYLNNDGLHVSLADDERFNVIVLRGGAAARVYVDADGLAEPKGKEPLCRFAGGGEIETVSLPQLVKAKRVSFFGVEGGTVADVAFYRVEQGVTAGSGAEVYVSGAPTLGLLPEPQSKFAPESLYLAMKERYGDRHHVIAPLLKGTDASSPLILDKGRPAHLLSEPLGPGRGLAAVRVAAKLSGAVGEHLLTVVVQDPLDPRLDLTWIELTVEVPGEIDLYLDIPDQVLLEDSRLWLTLRSEQDLRMAGFQLSPHWVSKEQALPEALSWRKLLMKSFFSLLSEPRPWGAYGKQPREEFYGSSRYAAQCPELFMTIDQCHALAPDDDLVRQYREWVYLRHLDELSELSAPPEPPAGVPAWAWYPRLAWLEVRRIAQWWLDERLVPTGEFGGRVGDDTDLYQQFADLPFFEDDGAGKRLRESGAKLAELADRDNLRGGLNVHATDSLHAYEEGINHLALMARWFYGDPVYLERCMESARNTEALTVVTDDGRRHFRDNTRMGFEDIAKPREPRVDGAANPLMWHTALQVADYNRNPRVLKVLQEWADTWLRLMQPGQWATDVEVLSGKIVDSQPNRPLYGGYRTQAVTFVWLYALTGQDRYVEPFLHYYRQRQAPLPADVFLGDAFCLGALDSLERTAFEGLVRQNPALALYLTSDPRPLIQATIGSPRSSQQGIDTLYNARRWPDMYTTSHQFTDRVFPSLLQQASISYLGGYCRRNKYNPTQAVSWLGFGTDYAALVLKNRRTCLKVLVYSFAAQPMTGRMRVWALSHGLYAVRIGPDTNGDFSADRMASDGSIELAKGDSIDLTIQPGTVTVVEVEQKHPLDSIFTRADLALVSREVKLRGRALTGVVHNVGSAEVDDVLVAVVDAEGRMVSRKSLGALEAPVDLVPRRTPFTLPVPEGPPVGWKLVLDPENRVPEIYEGNNQIDLSVIEPE